LVARLFWTEEFRIEFDCVGRHVGSPLP
jgi:hypothetical protein